MHSEKEQLSIEVCFSPLSWPLFQREEALVIVTDIFRASTAICAAFHNGVDAIIPVAEVSESEVWKQKGYIVAGERDGKKLACADFGNSPFNFLDPGLRGKTVVMNTTNGTQAIKMAGANSGEVAIGSFLNLTALCHHALSVNKHILIFCAGWKDRFSLEDTLFAGAMVEKLLHDGKGRFYTNCDSAIASADLWLLAKGNPLQYIEKAAHRHRLKRMGLDDILEYALTQDITEAIPVLVDGVIRDGRRLSTQVRTG
jgi:2-phosphosulfolactate phosphatase